MAAIEFTDKKRKQVRDHWLTAADKIDGLAAELGKGKPDFVKVNRVAKELYELRGGCSYLCAGIIEQTKELHLNEAICRKHDCPGIPFCYPGPDEILMLRGFAHAINASRFYLGETVMQDSEERVAFKCKTECEQYETCKRVEGKAKVAHCAAEMQRLAAEARRTLPAIVEEVGT